MNIEQFDAELSAARESLRRLREDTVAQFTAEAGAETNPYTREALLAAVARVRATGNRS